MATTTSSIPAKDAPGGDALADLSFEQAAGELEGLVEDMENNVLPLEQMLAHYERGVKLAQQCARRLSDAEKRIELIKRLPEGGVTLVPLDEAAEEAAPAKPVRSPARKPVAAPPAANESTSTDNDEDDDDELSLF